MLSLFDSDMIVLVVYYAANTYVLVEKSRIEMICRGVQRMLLRRKKLGASNNGEKWGDLIASKDVNLAVSERLEHAACLGRCNMCSDFRVG